MEYSGAGGDDQGAVAEQHGALAPERTARQKMRAAATYYTRRNGCLNEGGSGVRNSSSSGRGRCTFCNQENKPTAMKASSGDQNRIGSSDSSRSGTPVKPSSRRCAVMHSVPWKPSTKTRSKLSRDQYWLCSSRFLIQPHKQPKSSTSSKMLLCFHATSTGPPVCFKESRMADAAPALFSLPKLAFTVRLIMFAKGRTTSTAFCASCTKLAKRALGLRNFAPIEP
mmetsp:Transcript_103741/g.274690  ORF Transcript_103741/g.274690 Transcript_103741/m.274690 type:complete len:225 (-) Transcript_103741:320-994(-)